MSALNDVQVLQTSDAALGSGGYGVRTFASSIEVRDIFTTPPPSPTPSPTPTVSPSPSPSPSPTPTPTPSPAAEPAPTPTLSPIVTATPDPSPTPADTLQPIYSPEPQPNDPILYGLIVGTIILLVGILAILLWKK